MITLIICDSLWKLSTLLKTRVEAKKIHRVIEFNQSHCLKQYVDFNTHKKIEAEKKWWQRWKSIVQINEQCYIRKNNGKIRISVKVVSNKKDYLKWTSKASYMSHKIFDNDEAVICKNKVTLTLNKPSYIGMCTLELSKVLMYEFHYYSIKNKYGNNSRLLFTDIGSLVNEIKTEDIYEGFSNDKEMFDFSNYSTKSKYYDNSNKLLVGKMKDETADVAIGEFVGWKPKMYSYLVNDNSEHKKAKGLNKNIAATISHNEYKDVLLNKKCLRHYMNRTQS